MPRKTKLEKRIEEAKKTLKANRNWFVLRQQFQLALTTQPDTMDEVLTKIESGTGEHR